MNGYNFVNNSETRLLESYAELPIRHLSSLKQVIQYVWYYIASWSQNSQKVMNHSNLTKSEKKNVLYRQRSYLESGDEQRPTFF